MLIWKLVDFISNPFTKHQDFCILWPNANIQNITSKVSTTAPNHTKHRVKKYSKQPEIPKPMPIRKLVDFRLNPFTEINIFVFCDQVPFGVHFKRHCTRQWLNFVLSLTVRTPLFWGDAVYVPRNPESDAHPKTCRFHIKSFYKNQHFCILRPSALLGSF